MTENKRRIYISGPISGVDGYRSIFAAEAERLRAQGHFVINPAELDLDEGATWENYMRANLIQMLDTCNAMVMLPGWGKSRGARIEYSVAVALGFHIEDAAGDPPALNGAPV